jgi:hypothetical protein
MRHPDTGGGPDSGSAAFLPRAWAASIDFFCDTHGLMPPLSDWMSGALTELAALPPVTPEVIIELRGIPFRCRLAEPPMSPLRIDHRSGELDWRFEILPGQADAWARYRRIVLEEEWRRAHHAYRENRRATQRQGFQPIAGLQAAQEVSSDPRVFRALCRCFSLGEENGTLLEPPRNGRGWFPRA